jgi:quercetin dioxygenase-like cupin family protein
MSRNPWLTGMIVGVTLLILAGSALAQAETCPEIVRAALDEASDACVAVGRNQICYGNVRLEGEPKAGVEDFMLAEPGDIVDAALVQTLRLSALDEAADTWGVALMSLQANLPATLPGQNVTFLLFGDVEIRDLTEDEADTKAPLQAFYFKSGLKDAPCPEAPDSGVLIQTPAGEQRVEFRINEVDIALGSTAYVQAQPDGEMTASVLEGQAEVTAFGTTVTVPQGFRVTVPLDAAGNASGAPNEPEEFDPTTLSALPISLLPRSISLEATPEATSDASGAIIPVAGQWHWVTGETTSSGCESELVGIIVSGSAPSVDFPLPGDAFDLEIFFNSAMGNVYGLPSPVFSNIDPNTYVVSFSAEGGYEGSYTVTVLSPTEIHGQMDLSVAGCVIAMPFTVTPAGG